MTLRRKTLLIIGLALVVAAVALYATSSLTLMGGFAKIEEQDTQQNVSRALAALSDDFTELSRSNRDYAAWDDTYAFIEDANNAYIENNLADSTFSNLRLNLIVFFDTSGRVVFGKGFDLENEVEVSVPQSLYQRLTVNSPFLKFADPNSGLTGIILLPEGPALISTWPILTSADQGPVRGTLLFGRYLNSAEIGELANSTRLSLAVRQLNDLQLPLDFQAVRNSFSKNTPIVTRPLNDQTIAGYAQLTDVDKQPVLLLRVDLPRTIYQQGQASMRYFIISLLAVGLVVGAGGVWLSETFVLSRLAGLSAQVSDIAASSDHSARIVMAGKDELRGLADTINRMLETLEHAQYVRQESEALRESERRLRRHANQLQGVTEVAKIATTLLDPGQLIAQAVDLIQTRFGFYYVGLFLLGAEDRFAVLQQGTGEAGRVMKSAGHRLEVGGQSMVGWACAHKAPRIALDVGQEAVRFVNPLLPDTHSEMALPLRAGERVLGALDVQSTQKAAFDEDDIATLQGMADQIAVALENARLFQQSETTLKELEMVNRLLAREGWQGQLSQPTSIRRVEFSPARMSATHLLSQPLTLPLELRGQQIGRLLISREGGGDWSEDEVETIQAIALQTVLAADNARLIEQTQRALDETRVLYETSREITSAGEISEVLAAVLDNLARTGVHGSAIAMFDAPTREQATHFEVAAAWDHLGTLRIKLGTRFPIAAFPLFDRITSSEALVSQDFLADPQIDDMAKQVLGGMGFRAMAITPLSARGQWIGVLFVLVEQAHKFTQAELDFQRALADQAAVAIDSRRLLAETQRRAQREHQIYEITSRIRRSPDIATILRTTVEELGRALQTDRAMVRLAVKPDGKREE
jgi:sensor domain CHASE-containing protein/GAF domain-containing protein